MNQFQIHKTKGEEPDSKGHITWHSGKGKNIGTENESVDARGEGEWEGGVDYEGAQGNCREWHNYPVSWLQWSLHDCQTSQNRT